MLMLSLLYTDIYIYIYIFIFVVTVDLINCIIILFFSFNPCSLYKPDAK